MRNTEYQIEYNGEVIPYELVKSKIKNMYIYIKNGKVTVKVPTRIKDKYIQDFVSKKSRWIYEKVKQDKEKTEVEEKLEQKDIENLEIVVKNSVERYTELLKKRPNKVRIKDMKYAWGSCSSNKNISINRKLAKKDEKVIEYVVLHEMCHLKYMNHSKDFWNLVETYMPEYKDYKKILKQ